MDIEQNAPLVARKEIIINAPVEQVWQKLTDFKNWPKWQKDIFKVQVSGPLKRGTKLKWLALGALISSTIHTAEENKSLGWSGITIGMRAIHNWYFESQGDTTKVVTEESLAGILPPLIKAFQPQFLDHNLESALKSLKAAVEK